MRKALPDYLSLLLDLILIAVGIFFFRNSRISWTVIYVLMVIYCFAIPLRVWRNQRDGIHPISVQSVIILLFHIGFGITILVTPERFFHWVHIFFGWWMIGDAFLSNVILHVIRRDHLKGGPYRIWHSLYAFIMGILMIFGKSLNIQISVMSILGGVFFILYGLASFISHLRLLYPDSRIAKLTEWTVSLPVLLSAFVPLMAYESIAKLEEDALSDPREKQDCDLEVFIYLKGEGPEIFGHIDISLDGTIYSYGCHDPATRKLAGTLGDGVLIVSERDSFLDEAIYTDHKTIIGYGFQLSEQQKTKIRQRIDDIMQRAVPWHCAAEKAAFCGDDLSRVNDYASRVWKETRCNFYKFTSGKFRTYFAGSTNCVLLADELVRSKEARLLDINGIVVPGTYLDFLNYEYNLRRDLVISRKLYRYLPAAPAGPELEKTGSS